MRGEREKRIKQRKNERKVVGYRNKERCKKTKKDKRDKKNRKRGRRNNK